MVPDFKKHELSPNLQNGSDFKKHELSPNLQNGS
jgi:hypothetical protein